MTFQPLSYGVLKTIIGHLTLEKRIKLSYSCQKLRIAERNSIFQVDNIGISKHYFYVHDIEFGIFETGGETSVFIQRKPEKELVFEGDFSEKVDELLGTLVDVYLTDRGSVKVKRLNCEYELYQLSKFPKRLKIECEELRLRDRQLQTIQEISRFLTTPFPEKLTICLDAAEDLLFEHDFIRNANFLAIKKTWRWTDKDVNQLIQLRSKIIHVKTDVVHFKPENVSKIAKDWLARCPQPEVGTRFTMVIRKYDYVLDVMDFIRDELEAVPGEVLEEELRNSALRHCVTIQMRSGDEMNIFGGVNKDKKQKERWLFRMEVMKKGSSRIVKR